MRAFIDMNGVIIGLLSSLGSALLIALICLVIYFFRYTTSGRIFLDRIGRPGEYDDEQAFAREEAEALESMDDMQRTEYLRAKGNYHQSSFGRPGRSKYTYKSHHSIHPRTPSRVGADGYFTIAILGHTGERRIGMGVRAGVGDRELFRRSEN